MAHFEQFLGFFNAIALSSNASLQDTLRLLTLWFKYGDHESIWTTINAGVDKVNIETWLPVCKNVILMIVSAELMRFQVIPQFIARIHISKQRVREAIHALLCNVGKAHPQVNTASVAKNLLS